MTQAEAVVVFLIILGNILISTSKNVQMNILFFSQKVLYFIDSVAIFNFISYFHNTYSIYSVLELFEFSSYSHFVRLISHILLKFVPVKKLPPPSVGQGELFSCFPYLRAMVLRTLSAIFSAVRPYSSRRKASVPT